MSTSSILHRESGGGGCESHDHVALFYDGDREYLDGVTRFIARALDAGEPVVAAVPPERGRLLHDSSSALRILDMFELGRNPARIIPELEALFGEYGGARLHVIGEPVWPGRSPEEIREVTKHEALINVAWPDARIRTLCPYDAAALRPEVLDGAERTHPWVIRHGRGASSGLYSEGAIPAGCDQPLALPPDGACSMCFGIDDLFKLRSMVGDVAHDAGLGDDRTADLMLVTSELSTNAIRHGDGTGVLHAWRAGREVICQVNDHGQIADPLAGRRRPVPRGTGGLGLWMVNQLCDLVEVRSGTRGTTVRAHVSLS
jgi:anti-sigma regulatory factor (Ser/Thr protein kinase)